MIDSGRFDSAQVYYNAINPSAAWSRVPPDWNGRDFSGVIAACFRQNMGVLSIRVWAGGTLASPEPPEGLFLMTTGTELDNEMRCAAAVKQALGAEYGRGTDGVALRARQPGYRHPGDRYRRAQASGRGAGAVRQGPLPTAGDLKLYALWANDFQPRLTPPF